MTKAESIVMIQIPIDKILAPQTQEGEAEQVQREGHGDYYRPPLGRSSGRDCFVAIWPERQDYPPVHTFILVNN